MISTSAIITFNQNIHLIYHETSLYKSIFYNINLIEFRVDVFIMKGK